MDIDLKTPRSIEEEKREHDVLVVKNNEVRKAIKEVERKDIALRAMYGWCASPPRSSASGVASITQKFMPTR